MKRILAVALLLMSFASAALADGPGFPPVKSLKPPKVSAVLLADGGGPHPPGSSTQTEPPKATLAA